MPNMNIKKLWRRKSVNITDYDPTYKVIYLGNVLTGWAKGEGCVEKPLATLWRNYCQSNRPDISMKVTICGAGLRAVTKEHGLTEYWAHRVTHCSAHPSYPRVFCWVYRHEGRRLKQELRCHAVLCPKQDKAEVMSLKLKDRLNLALQEFRREKVIRQNARLSVMHAIYDSATFPMRKLYLVTGSSNYRPPLERSKSAPKLGAIEELLEEEEQEEAEMESARLRRNRAEMSVLARIGRSSPISEEINECEVTAGSNFCRDLMIEAEKILSDQLPCNTSVNFSPDELISSFSTDKLDTDSDSLVFKESSTDVPLDISSPTFEDQSTEVVLLTSLKDNLSLRHSREDSLISDQPESIGCHSCTSSCEGCSEGTPEGDILLVEIEERRLLSSHKHRGASPTLKGDHEEEDNISEESGYSEAKDCLCPTDNATINV